MTISFQTKEVELQQFKDEVARLQLLDSVQRGEELEASLNTITLEMETLQQQKDQVGCCWAVLGFLLLGICCWVLLLGICSWVLFLGICSQGCSCWVLLLGICSQGCSCWVLLLGICSQGCCCWVLLLGICSC
jgi:hypothetical protein